MNYLKASIAFVLAVVIGVAIYGAYQYPKQILALGSPVGATFGTAKIAAVNISPLTGAASSTSILNTDSSARWVKSTDAACTGVGTSFAFVGQAGIASWLLQAATTSQANNGLQGNTNYVSNMIVGTSTSFSQSASSTVASTLTFGTDNYYWPSGSYLTFTFNATNTAACTVSASYIAS